MEDSGMNGSVLAADLKAQLYRRYQRLLDRTAIHPYLRWGALAGVLVVYTLRVMALQGWYIVTYGLGIYMLNLLIGFMTPQFDPDTEGPVLPTKAGEEYKPFTRKLQEFKFWQSAMQATVMAFVFTFFSVFDIPVFWPILLLYFLVLFVLTMKNQIAHMIKYRYIPCSWGKARYTGGKGKKPAVEKPTIAAATGSSVEPRFTGSNIK